MKYLATQATCKCVGDANAADDTRVQRNEHQKSRAELHFHWNAERNVNGIHWNARRTANGIHREIMRRHRQAKQLSI